LKKKSCKSYRVKRVTELKELQSYRVTELQSYRVKRVTELEELYELKGFDFMAF